MGKSKKIIAAAGLLVFAGTLLVASKGPPTPVLRGRGLSDTVESAIATANLTEQALVLRRGLSAAVTVETSIKKYKLTEQAQAWCEPSKFPPLDYHKCNADDVVYMIPFMAGLTNGLKMMLLTVIGILEENKCFFVSENPKNKLLFRDDKSHQLGTFLGRYFEPIGLSKDDPIVANARQKKQIQRTDWKHYWDSAKRRRVHGRLHNITSLGYENIESTVLKRTMLQRMWRLLPDVRDNCCSSLESHGLEEEYLAFSVRRGDKGTEGFEFTKPEDYVVAAEEARVKHFAGKMPKIFVATDDCAVMGELRQLRPGWVFVSECDRMNNNDHRGFILAGMKTWTLEQTVSLVLTLNTLWWYIMLIILLAISGRALPQVLCGTHRFGWGQVLYRCCLYQRCLVGRLHETSPLVSPIPGPTKYFANTRYVVVWWMINV